MNLSSTTLFHWASIVCWSVISWSLYIYYIIFYTLYVYECDVMCTHCQWANLIISYHYKVWHRNICNYIRCVRSTMYVSLCVRLLPHSRLDHNIAFFFSLSLEDEHASICAANEILILSLLFFPTTTTTMNTLIFKCARTVNVSICKLFLNCINIRLFSFK